mmetsp:Transcript_53523/g.125588  ORF Transcript_53523/g.125588 Transcript_53523/m.125588 type:complete len:202 (+) Transcript_53523:707-1312(+)
MVQSPAEGHAHRDTFRCRVAEHHGEDKHGFSPLLPLDERFVQRGDLRLLFLIVAMQALARSDEEPACQKSGEDLPVQKPTVLVSLEQHAGRRCQHHAGGHCVGHGQAPDSNVARMHKQERNSPESCCQASQQAVCEDTHDLPVHALVSAGCSRRRLPGHDGRAHGNPQHGTAVYKLMSESWPGLRLRRTLARCGPCTATSV